MPIRAITFDFWYTLFEDDGGDIRRRMRSQALAHVAQVPYDTADTVLEKIYAKFLEIHTAEQRTLTPNDAVRMAETHLETTFSQEDASQLVQTFGDAIVQYPPRPIKAALDAVRLAAQHCPIGLISDTGISPGASLEKILDQHAFTPHFTTLTFSDHLGVSKPQAAMFQHTAKVLGVSPNEILHLGDLEPTDIAGIQNLGGQGGLFTGSNPRYQDTTQADYIFPCWQDFIDQLPKLLP